MNTNEKVTYTLLLDLPLVLTLILWWQYGFPESVAPDGRYYLMQILMTLATIGAVPVLLKYITAERQGDRYKSLCLARMTFLACLSIVNVVLYFHVTSQVSFFYLAAIAWLAMFFSFPTKGDQSDIED